MNFSQKQIKNQWSHKWWYESRSIIVKKQPNVWPPIHNKKTLKGLLYPMNLWPCLFTQKLSLISEVTLTELYCCLLLEQPHSSVMLSIHSATHGKLWVLVFLCSELVVLWGNSELNLTHWSWSAFLWWPLASSFGTSRWEKWFKPSYVWQEIHFIIFQTLQHPAYILFRHHFFFLKTPNDFFLFKSFSFHLFLGIGLNNLNMFWWARKVSATHFYISTSSRRFFQFLAKHF